MSCYENTGRRIELLFDELSHSSKRQVVDDLVRQLKDQQAQDEAANRKDIMYYFSKLSTADQKYVCKMLMDKYAHLSDDRPHGISAREHERQLDLNDLLDLKPKSEEDNNASDVEQGTTEK